MEVFSQIGDSPIVRRVDCPKLSPFFANSFQSYRSTCSPSKLFSFRSVKKFKQLFISTRIIFTMTVSRLVMESSYFLITGSLYMYHNDTQQPGKVEYKIKGESRLLKRGSFDVHIKCILLLKRRTCQYILTFMQNKG